MEFGAADFIEVTGETGQALLKRAAYSEILKQQSQEAKIELSLKHQILCDETALVGVIKQKDKATGELKEVGKEMTKEIRRPGLPGRPAQFFHHPNPRRLGGRMKCNQKSNAMPIALAESALSMKNSTM